MTSFRSVLRASERQVIKLAEKTGVDIDLATKVMIYARRLGIPDEPTQINENIFCAQLLKRFGMTNGLIVHLTYDLFKIKSKDTISVDDYATLICTYLSPDIDKHIDLVFKIYDLDHDMKLGKPELSTFIGSKTFVQQTEDTEMEIKDLHEVIMNAVDKGNNKSIDIHNFRRIVKIDNLFLGMLGPAMPSDQHLAEFRKLLRSKNSSQVRAYFESERSTSLKGPTSLLKKKDKHFPVALDID